MFVGHYSVSFLVKGTDKKIPLWVLFLAVQFVDIFWALFVLLGIEKVRIVPGITATNPLDLYYMPYTHSLVAALGWFGVAFFAYKFFAACTNRLAFLVGLAVLSHWPLDLVVHKPDLPLYDVQFKMGLGLWNSPVLAFLLEVLLLLGGIVLYFRSTQAKTPAGKYSMFLFGAAMFAVQALVFFGPPPPSPSVLALTGLTSYFLFAGIAFWLEKKRV